MQTFECPSCHAGLRVSDSPPKTIECEYCGTNIIVPKELRDDPSPEQQPAHIHVSTSSQPQNNTSPVIGPILVLSILCMAAVGALVAVAGATGTSSVTSIMVDIGVMEEPPDGERPSGGIANLPIPTPRPTEPPYLLEIGSTEEGTGPGRFEDLRWVGVDGEGIIYTAEHDGGRIQQFQSDGEFTQQWNLVDDGPVISFSVGRDGTVYVVQGFTIDVYQGGERIQTIDMFGDFNFHVTIPTLEGNLIGAERDSLIFLDSNYQTLMRVDEALGDRADSPVSSPKLAVSGDGRIYMVTTFNDAVFVFDSQGVYQDRIGDESTINSPNGIVIDGRGRIIVSTFDGITVFAPDGRHLGSFDPLEPGSPYFGLAVDDEDNVYIASRTRMVKLALPSGWE